MIRNSGNFQGDGFKTLEARIRALGKKKIVVGIPASKNSDQDGTSMVTIAAAHEFGAEINVPAKTVTVYRKVNSDGSFAEKGKFVKASKANFASTHRVPAHTIKIPERSFLRSTLNENKDKYADELAKGIKSELLNDGDPRVALDKVGGMIAGDVKAKIMTGIPPPLSPKTIKRKKSSKALIDNGQLLQSITYEVREDG
ncbi:hypothetical protein [Xenorhabdus anantnagensis]|uniref:Phage protein n=1 Tax=Xenorhabdus anantnagensis TaxID=3025875 RepID=A0ABT5LWL0_9GAMM|nr:hypothetical protein [Xenorhabdus anantnagensis]MDC9598831.1 hypothetical protein [Xenorhabdus anantnagensis]